MIEQIYFIVACSFRIIFFISVDDLYLRFCFFVISMISTAFIPFHFLVGENWTPCTWYVQVVRPECCFVGMRDPNINSFTRYGVPSEVSNK